MQLISIRPKIFDIIISTNVPTPAAHEAFRVVGLLRLPHNSPNCANTERSANHTGFRCVFLVTVGDHTCILPDN